LLESLRDVDPRRVPVSKAMSRSVYAVQPSALLDEVVLAMAEHKYGCAVVMQDQHVVGILTTVDVCRTLGELLRARLTR
jgi:CBS domain-containing protein